MKTPERVAIIGQGYVGLPLSLLFSEQSISVSALDIDNRKIDNLLRGISYISHINSSRVEKSVLSGFLEPSLDFSKVANAKTIIICVPTPLDTNQQPDMSFVTNTARTVGQYLSHDTLVVLESTAYPGATEELLKPILEKTSGLRAGHDFFLAFSPEREDPGNPLSKVESIPKLIGGLTPRCSKKAIAIYSQIVESVIPVASCKIAEAAKLTENIFRSVNIAMVNELKVIFQHMEIDVWEVIEAAKTKPFGYMPFYPGPGLGGHCIPIDPYYLSWKAKEFGLTTKFIELAGEINRLMPEYVVQRLNDALNNEGKAINGSRILIIGLAYKKNVDDARESPAFAIMDLITSKKGIVEYYDPYIPVIPVTREHSKWANKKSIKFLDKTIKNFDAAIIVTDHDRVDHKTLLKHEFVIIDTRNRIQPINSEDQQKIWRA